MSFWLIRQGTLRLCFDVFGNEPRTRRLTWCFTIISHEQPHAVILPVKNQVNGSRGIVGYIAPRHVGRPACTREQGHATSSGAQGRVFGIIIVRSIGCPACRSG